jgi:hypothetical protein
VKGDYARMDQMHHENQRDAPTSEQHRQAERIPEVDDCCHHRRKLRIGSTDKVLAAQGLLQLNRGFTHETAVD